MNQTRGFLYIALAVLSFLLFQNYLTDSAPKPEKTNEQISSSTVIANEHPVEINNGLLKLTVNSQTGDFISASLDKYSVTIEDKTPLNVLSVSEDLYTTVVNGLYGAQGTDSATTRADYKVVSKTETSVTLSYTKNDVSYLKTILLVPNSYEVRVKYDVKNNRNDAISLAPYSQFLHKELEGSSLFSKQNIYGTNSSYAGVVVSTDQDNYEKISYGDQKDGDFPVQKTSKGWTAISMHFFVDAYVPKSELPFTISSSYDKNSKVYYLKTLTDLQTVPANSEKTFNDSYWFGPKLQDQLDKVGPDLDLVVDYGWAWFLSTPLWKLMSFLHSLLGNWGLTIIALTISVRIIILPLSIIQFKNQALMRVIQPELAAANERAGDDRMKKMQETQKVFHKYGASQFTGCLPALIQLPIFLALFYLVNEAVELRHQPFFGWIHDLSQSDPYFILPILNGLIMVYMFSLNPMPENMDPTQKKVMKMMPYMFMIFFLFLPSGLIAYYIISNLITIGLLKYFNYKISKAFKEGTLPTYSSNSRKKKNLKTNR